ncbi:MAG TPA: single-stranded-DNA-specific exonuclease RecJ [Candidatus Limnocylindrales bacterium]|nr:single-stranded-DNA-specific exonuclease RecJ [Candidatus Limnocylindrales bacterium]
MVEPRARWAFPEPAPLDPSVIESGARLGLSPRVLGLLATRGVRDGAAVEAFFGDPRLSLNDPERLPDATTFRDRIERARAAGERVMVFGDFDADGITGLAVLTIALRRFGVDVLPYVPSRLDEGHGLSRAAVETAEREGATVIVTVDTGTSSLDEVAFAVERGIDVLVTDHHRVPDRMPAALAVVNPQRPDASYPDRRLAGSGIAFTIARLLLGDAALDLADLAAIGTVADVAPVLGENRSIARLGLERIQSGPRPGVAALLAGANVAPADVDLETLGFVVAPRLNAAGRVGEAMDAASLLLAEDAAEAERLAAILEDANVVRRDLTKSAIAEARTSADAVDGAPATIVRGPWPVGIVGLVASRLADERGVPAIVGAELGDVIRASCRSDGRIHLADTLATCGDLLIRHGGHAGAAGFEIATERWEAFRTRILELVAAAGPVDATPSLTLDLALPASDVDYGLHREIARLAPCGTGNQEPLVAVLGLTVVRVREATGGHTQVVLKRERDVLDGIAFGWPELASLVAEGDRLDVVGRLMSRRFGGLESLQLEIRDAAMSGTVPGARAILERRPVPVGPGAPAGGRDFAAPVVGPGRVD